MSSPVQAVQANLPALLKAIVKFDPERHHFADWFEQFEEHCLMMNLDQATTKRMLVLSLVDDAFVLLKSTMYPASPLDQNVQYGDVCRVLFSHYSVCKTQPVARLEFTQVRQGESESVQQFITRLQNATKFCDFGEELGSRIRDQFIFGLYSHKLQMKLVKQAHLDTWAKLSQYAISLERQQKDANELALRS